MTDPPLSPRQIVYLACGESRLYSEVIQILDDRQRCWARPLLLVTSDQVIPLNSWVTLEPSEPPETVVGAKTPDLIWPIEQFLPALEVDFLALLPYLDPSYLAEASNQAKPALQEFMTRLWAILASA